LKLAGIDRNTVAPAGGLIVKDSAGEPTGVLKDNAMDLVNRVIPTASPAQYDQALDRALQEAREKGVTSIQDITQNNDLRTYQSFEKKGRLTCRIYTRMAISSNSWLMKNSPQVPDHLYQARSLKALRMDHQRARPCS
jgi:predicted amidohydrolase YtcJ